MQSDPRYIGSLLERATNPAISNILARRLAQLESRQPDPSRKLGIVVEGGAMRAVISGGSFIALDFLQLNETFDVIYGSSAGAINAAYFLSHQIGPGVAVYYQLINNRKFIVLPGLLDLGGKSKVVDMDFLFDSVITSARALDVDAVRNAATELWMSVTNAVDGSARLVSARDRSVPLATALKASAAIPVYYNRPVMLGDTPYVDGSVANALPMAEAVASGCTDILVILTRPVGYRKEPDGGLARLYERLRLAAFSRRFRNSYFSRAAGYNRSLDLIFGKAAGAERTNVAVVAPSGRLGKTSTSGTALRGATATSVLTTLQTFGASDVAVTEVLQPYRRNVEAGSK